MGDKLKRFLSRKFTAHPFGAHKPRRPAAPLLAAAAFAIALAAPAMAEENETLPASWGPSIEFNQNAPASTFGPNRLMSPQQVNPLLHEYLDQRIVRITGTITDESAAQTIAALRMLDDNNPEGRDIELRIHSTGGSVMGAFAIYDAIKSLKSDVKTVCEGEAMSMGSFLLATGTPGKRMSMPHCRIMIHQPWGGAQGQITNMQIQVQEGQVLKDLKINIMAAYTGLDPADLAALMERDMYLSPTDAMELGLIDGIIAPVQKMPEQKEKREIPERFFERHKIAARITPVSRP